MRQIAAFTSVTYLKTITYFWKILPRTSQELIWADPDRIIIPAKNVNEPRYLIIGKINNICWSAIYTIRKENIRIISVRRSRENEKEIYES
ncbi:MAG: BrnT family toxin [Ignavibacteria bacterium]